MFLEFSVCWNRAPGLSVLRPLWVLMWRLRTLCWVVPALLGRPRSEDSQPLPPEDPPPTLLRRNSSRYLSSLALVIWRNTDSRHFSDTVILPILRFRFFFPLPPGSLVCFSPAVWRCWWPEGAAGEEWLARAGSGEDAEQPLGAVTDSQGPIHGTLGPTARKCLQGWEPALKQCAQSPRGPSGSAVHS